MKTAILLSSVFAVGAAFAGTAVSSGNAIGALDVAISNAPAQTLISVPFVGYTGGAVAVKDIVKTSNLAAGSKLYAVADGGGYNTWTLNASGEWVADAKVTILNGGQPVAGTADNQGEATINRGDAFWIQPVFKDSATGGTIFLLGQEAGDGTSTAEANTWNLVGNASVEMCSLKNLTGATGDQIVVQVDGGLRYYSYKEGKGWRYTTKDGTWSNPATDPLTIAAGHGFWYRPATDKTIDWSTLKVVTP